jgi:serine protease Do
VNTAIFSPTGGSIGIGFAVPSEIAQDVAAQLREHGSVQRGYLGVQIQEITPELANALNLPGREGALVTEVTRNTPAATAGLQPGDVIVGFEGKPVQGPRDLARAVAQVAPGSRANVTILREGQRREQTVQIAQMRPPGEETKAQAGSPEQSATGQGRLGLQLAPLTPELRKEFGLPTEATGVAVVGVAPGSPAAERGIQPGDVIVRAGQKQVSRPEEVAEAVNTAREKGQKSVVVLVQRRQGAQFVPIPLPG